MEISHVFRRIEEKATTKFDSVRQLILAIPLSENAWHSAKRTGDIKYSTLQRIAELLDLPVSYFVSEDGSSLAEPGATYGNETVLDILTRIDKTTQETNKLIKKNKK